MTRRTRKPTGPAALLRLWRPDGNPLRRTADRAEAIVIMVLLLIVLAGAPLAALAVGHGVSASSARAERTESSWRQVPAMLVRDAPRLAHAHGQANIEPLVPARWTAPDGTPREGKVYAPSGARARSTVMVWTDSSGQMTGVPMQPSVAGAQAALGASLAAIMVGALAGCAWLIVHRVLDRRRLSAWDSGWAETGPQWSGQR